MSYWPVLEPYWESVDIYNGSDKFIQTYRGVPAVVRTLCAAHWCESEVSNGGLRQFFWNATGVLAPEAALAFRELGLPDLAAIVEEAMLHFGDPYPRETRDRRAVLPPWESGVPSPFSSLDERFWDACDSSAGKRDGSRLYDAMDQYSERGRM